MPRAVRYAKAKLFFFAQAKFYKQHKAHVHTVHTRTVVLIAQ